MTALQEFNPETGPAAYAPLRTPLYCSNILTMKLNSITANCHIFEGRVNGKPLRLRLEFDDGASLRLQVAGDGSQMIIDEGQLDTPFDMDSHGRVQIFDVTQALFQPLSGVELTEIKALKVGSSVVGVALVIAASGPFYFWVDSDELYWGDERLLISHDWLNQLVPCASERIAL